MPVKVPAAVPPWLIYDLGAEAADDLLRACGYEPRHKAYTPLTAAGYDVATRRLLRLIAAAVSTPDRAAIQRAAAKLDASWDTMSAGRRNAVIEAAASSLLEVPRIVVPKIGRIISGEASRVIADTKAALAPELKIGGSLDDFDRRIAEHAGRSQASYVTDVYGNRVEEFSERARGIVSKGLEEGLGREEIGERLKSAVVDPMLRKADSYWNMIAAVHTTRARSWAQLSSFRDAEIERYVWTAIDDEGTCDACDMLDGKEFGTSDAIDTWEDVEDADDPTDVEDLQPWIRTGEDEEGNRVLFVEKDGERHGLARVERSAEGEKDVHGRFSQVASAAKLQDLGVDSPPAHAACRCTLVPA